MNSRLLRHSRSRCKKTESIALLNSARNSFTCTCYKHTALCLRRHLNCSQWKSQWIKYNTCGSHTDREAHHHMAGNTHLQHKCSKSFVVVGSPKMSAILQRCLGFALDSWRNFQAREEFRKMCTRAFKTVFYYPLISFVTFFLVSFDVLERGFNLGEKLSRETHWPLLSRAILSSY